MDLSGMTWEELNRIYCEIREEFVRRDICQHGVRSDDYCEPCNREYKRALAEFEAEIDA